MASDVGGTEGGVQSIGMPQLDFMSYSNQIFWLGITLVIIYFILSRVALPRIESILTERQSVISSDIAKAESLTELVKKSEEEYEKKLAETKAEAQNIAANTRLEIQNNLKSATERADEEIATKLTEAEQQILEIRAEAKSSVNSVAAEVAEQLVITMLGEVDREIIKASIQSRLKM
ncbi:MAG: F0F1 ATP synthase subunit B' [Aestuariivita sp.]|nr:F0F1 ATP synthase subunit B' [Aestuariivita sp.]